jgi:beta-barrel assembly-enhancing protease
MSEMQRNFRRSPFLLSCGQRIVCGRQALGFSALTLVMVWCLGSALAYAFDLGDKLRQLRKPDSGTTQERSAEPPSSPSLAELADLVKGTSVEEEIAIGQEIAGRLLGAAPLVPDENLQRYVNKVGRWLSLHSGREELDWYFGVLDSDDINAFAAPGGFIFLTRGLYAQLTSEAELAGVLGHEIGHVVKRHHLGLIQKSKAIDIGSGLFSKKLGKLKNEQAGQAVKTLIGSGAEILARGLDKEAEYQADRIGVVVASRAGYDPYGLPMVLQEIGHASLGDSTVALLFKTHPHPNARLSTLGESMGEAFDRYSGGMVGQERLYRIPQ